MSAPAELGVHGDVGASLTALLDRVEQKTDRSFLDKLLHENVKKLGHVVDAFTHDMRNVWAVRCLTLNCRRKTICSFVPGSMANALPHAMGALLTFSDSALGMIRERMVDGLPDHQTDFARVDYAAIARATGSHGIRVEDPTTFAAPSPIPARRSSTLSPISSRSTSRAPPSAKLPPAPFGSAVGDPGAARR